MMCPKCNMRMEEDVWVDSDGYADPLWACARCGHRENRALCPKKVE